MAFGVAPTYLTVNESGSVHVHAYADVGATGSGSSDTGQFVADAGVGVNTNEHWYQAGSGNEQIFQGWSIRSGSALAAYGVGIMPPGGAVDEIHDQILPDSNASLYDYLDSVGGFGLFGGYGNPTFGTSLTGIQVQSRYLYGPGWFGAGGVQPFPVGTGYIPINASYVDTTRDFGWSSVSYAKGPSDIRTIRSLVLTSSPLTDWNTEASLMFAAPGGIRVFATLYVKWAIDPSKAPQMPLWFVASDGSLTPYNPYPNGLVPYPNDPTTPPAVFTPWSYQYPANSGNYLNDGDNLYDIGIDVHIVYPPDPVPPKLPQPRAQELDEYFLRGAVGLVDGHGSPRLYAIGCHTRSSALTTYSLREVVSGPFGIMHSWVVDANYSLRIQSSDLVAVMSKDFGATWEPGVPVGFTAQDGSDLSNGRMSYGSAYIPAPGGTGAYADGAGMVNTHIHPQTLIVTPSGTLFARARIETKDPFGVLGAHGFTGWQTDTISPRLCRSMSMLKRGSAGAGISAWQSAITPNQPSPYNTALAAIAQFAVAVWQPAGAYLPSQGNGGDSHGPSAIYAVMSDNSALATLVSQDGGDTWTLASGVSSAQIGHAPTGGRDVLIPVCSSFIGKQNALIEDGALIGSSSMFGLAPGQADADDTLRFAGSHPCGASDTFIALFGPPQGFSASAWWIGHEYCGFSYEDLSVEPRYGHALPQPPNGPATAPAAILFWHWQGRVVCLEALGSGPGITAWTSDDEGRTMTRKWRSLDCLRTWQKVS